MLDDYMISQQEIYVGGRSEGARPHEAPYPLGQAPASNHCGKMLPDGLVARLVIGQETTGHFPFGVGVLFPVQRYSYRAVDLYVREVTYLSLGFRLIVVPAVDQTLVRV